MAAEETIQLSRVIQSLGGASEPQKQAEILYGALSKVSVRQAADYCYDIAEKSLDDLGYAKALLVLLDAPLLNKVFGKKLLGQISFTLKGNDKYTRLADVLERSGALDARTVKVLKAKAAMMFQLLYLVMDRIKDEGLPVLKITALEVVQRVISDENLSGNKLRVDLNQFGRAYWNLFVEQLKEADFRSTDNVNYEMLLNDSLIDQYETGSILVSSGAGGAGDARLSDAVLARLGSNIIKRLNLLLRTIQMYQSADHPSVSGALESLLSTVEAALQGRESLTLTRLGGDLLIEDVKIKKKDKFITDFIQALEVRNVNSLSLKKGLSLEEVRAFLMLFAETEAQIKSKGGVKKILDAKGVSHVLVDQFKYGIIADDAQEETQAMATDDRMLENIVFTEIVAKIRKGDLGDMNASEIGTAFKELISGSFRQDKNARKSLAQMILALDPELAEQAIFSKAGIRDEMSWTTARKMIDQLLADLDKGGLEERVHTLDNLEKMGELAITKNKETSLVQIIDRLTEKLRGRERDVDVLSKIFEVMASLARHLILNGKYAHALKLLRNVYNLRLYCENLPAEKKDDYSRAVSELVTTTLLTVSTNETVQALVRELEGETMATVDNAMKILETLGTEAVINGLLDAFKSPSRSLRNRCFQVLGAIGEGSLSICTWKLKNIKDPTQFSRTSENGPMIDESYYVARNCIDLVAKLGGEREVQLIREISDDRDPRVRREAITAMAKLNPTETVILAKMRLHDEDKEVVEGAIAALGQLGTEEHVRELIDLFYAEPSLRLTIINALGRIGGAEAEKLLLPAAAYRYGGNLGRIYRENDELRSAALRALGVAGREQARTALRRFIRRGSNMLFRVFFVPMRFRRKEMLKVAGDALSRIELRMNKA